MPARSGREYLESIRKQAPSVYLGGRRIGETVGLRFDLAQLHAFDAQSGERLAERRQ